MNVQWLPGHRRTKVVDERLLRRYREAKRLLEDRVVGQKLYPRHGEIVVMAAAERGGGSVKDGSSLSRRPAEPKENHG